MTEEEIFIEELKIEQGNPLGHYWSCYQQIFNQ